jgi:hypothetical protein
MSCKPDNLERGGMRTSFIDGFARPSDHSSNSQTQTTTPFDLERMVRSGGLEPPRVLPHSDLNAARLPFRHDRA